MTDRNAVHDPSILLVLMVVVFLNVAAFSVTGYLVSQALDKSAANDHRIDIDNYWACVKSNRLYSNLADIERDNPFKTTSPETIQRRVDLYTQAQSVCGVKP